MSKVQAFEKEYLRKKIPSFKPGDTVRVHVRVVEGDRERVQVFQGTVLRRQGGGLSETFTVRKVSFGVGTERTFPVHSPMVAKVEIKSRGTVRRAKLYYLRERVGKKARVKEMFVEGGLPESADIEHSEIEKKRLGLDQEPETVSGEEEPKTVTAEETTPAAETASASVAKAPEGKTADKPEEEIAPEAETAPVEETEAVDETETVDETPSVKETETAEEMAPAPAEVQQPASRDEARDLTVDKTADKSETEETPQA